MTDKLITADYTVLTPRDIYDEMGKYVIGQEQAKRTMATAVFFHFVRYCQIKEGAGAPNKSNALLMGPTGCGKTLVVREAAKAIRRLTDYPICPIIEIDCTEVSARGWEGESVTSLIKDAVSANREDVPETAIVFLDEFDKLCKPAVSSSGSDHNKNTQYNLLKTIEGTEIPGGGFGSSGTSTHDMLFVLAGNFSEIRHAREDRKNTLGFITQEAIETKEKTIDYHQELETAGMVTQLVGRTAYIGEILPLQHNELLQILNEHLIPEHMETLKYLGHGLKIPAKVKKEIVEKCIRQKTGARGLRASLATYLEDKLFDVGLRL